MEAKRHPKFLQTEVTTTFHKIAVVNPYGCDVSSISLMSVKTCSKAVLALSLGHGKSPCFSRRSVLKVVSVDYPPLVWASVNVGKFLECAF